MEDLSALPLRLYSVARQAQCGEFQECGDRQLIQPFAGGL